MAAVSTCQLANARHLLSDWTSAIGPLGIQLDPHRVRIEAIEKTSASKMCWTALVCTFTSPKRRVAHFSFSVMFPIDDVLARRAFIGSALTVGGGGREVVLSVYSRTARLAEKRGVKLAMLFRIRPTQAVGIPCASRE